jgi:hypothetical protein
VVSLDGLTRVGQMAPRSLAKGGLVPLSPFLNTGRYPEDTEEEDAEPETDDGHVPSIKC